MKKTLLYENLSEEGGVQYVAPKLTLIQNYAFVKKNPQFLRNHYKTLSKQGIHEDLTLTKFRNDWVKIEDFLIKAYVL